MSANTLMTAGNLKQFLATVPDDTPILERRCSDIRPMEMESWTQSKAEIVVSGPDGWGRPVTEDGKHYMDPYTGGTKMVYSRMARLVGTPEPPPTPKTVQYPERVRDVLIFWGN